MSLFKIHPPKKRYKFEAYIGSSKKVVESDYADEIVREIVDLAQFVEQSLRNGATVISLEVTNQLER